MKFKKRAVSIFLAVMLLITQPAMATEFLITMTGTASDTNVKGATVLVVNQGTDMSTVGLSDVLHIDQVDLEADGSFKFLLPFSLDGEYDVYSNMSEFTLGEFEKTKVLYVSENGNDENSGETADKPLATLAKAYESLWELKEIVVSGTVAYTNAPSYEDELIITGTSGAVLTLPSTVNLNGALSIDNVKLSGASNIYANGNKLYIGENVTTDTLLNVYGGCETSELTGDTDITILGGSYNKIYGGGKAKVNGNTNVVVGGTVNAGQTTGDGDSNAIYFYGGGANAAVTGKTNITFKDSAKVTKLYGAGSGENGTASTTNVLIQGGTIMNVFGGGATSTLTNTETNVTITGGKAEAIFGGNENAPMSGHTFVNLFGGKVTRRVYSGCYNNGSSSLFRYEYTTDHYVSGTTTLSIKPGVDVNSREGLSGTNAINSGLFAGSRTASSHSDEKNTVIFLDGCYNTYKGEMGEQNGSLYASYLKSFPNYLVNATTGGMVYGTAEGGKISLVPDKEKFATVNGTLCTGTDSDGNLTANATATLNASATTPNTVEFSKNFSIDSLSATSSSTGVTADVGFSAKNFWGEKSPKIIVAIYDELSGDLLDCEMVDATADMSSQTFNLDCKIVSGFTYVVKAMLWDGDVKPLTTSYRITFKK